MVFSTSHNSHSSCIRTEFRSLCAYILTTPHNTSYQTRLTHHRTAHAIFTSNQRSCRNIHYSPSIPLKLTPEVSIITTEKIEWLSPVISKALVARCGVKTTVPSANIAQQAFIKTTVGSALQRDYSFIQPIPIGGKAARLRDARICPTPTAMTLDPSAQQTMI